MGKNAKDPMHDLLSQLQEAVNDAKEPEHWPRNQEEFEEASSKHNQARWRMAELARVHMPVLLERIATDRDKIAELKEISGEGVDARKLIEELCDLQKVAERLPKDKDGKTIVYGSTMLHYMSHGGFRGPHSVRIIGFERENGVRIRYSDGEECWVDRLGLRQDPTIQKENHGKA